MNMYEQQGGLCPICGGPIRKQIGGRKGITLDHVPPRNFYKLYNTPNAERKYQYRVVHEECNHSDSNGLNFLGSLLKWCRSYYNVDQIP